MTNPLHSSSLSGRDTTRPAVRAAEILSNPPLVSGAKETPDVSPPRVAGGSMPRPVRILISATSREDAHAQARQVAAQLSRELHPIDLRQVESKYIRETEKKLLALVDTAAESDAILFFDEADALFGKRSDVRDAHDRYANLDPAFFLEQIENYPGPVIIATRHPARLDRTLLKQHAFAELRPRNSAG